jgi:hypothetical protein
LNRISITILDADGQTIIASWQRVIIGRESADSWGVGGFAASEMARSGTAPARNLARKVQVNLFLIAP